MIIHDLFAKHKRNKGAFSGRLLCPVCKGQANKLIERLTPFRYRYRCSNGKCGATFQYDTSGLGEHPYAPFKKQIFQEILANHKNGKTR